ncbi:HNH endonuclease [Ilyomonas limi]
MDHIIRKLDGGLGTIENGQLTHPFCNTEIKD